MAGQNQAQAKITDAVVCWVDPELAPQPEVQRYRRRHLDCEHAGARSDERERGTEPGLAGRGREGEGEGARASRGLMLIF